MASKSPQTGGLKHFFSKAYDSSVIAFHTSRQYAWVGMSMMGKTWFFGATTMIIVFMPLIMEISREPAVIDYEKVQVKELRSQGYNDTQLQQMGFSESILFAPAALAVN